MEGTDFFVFHLKPCTFTKMSTSLKTCRRSSRSKRRHKHIFIAQVFQQGFGLHSKSASRMCISPWQSQTHSNECFGKDLEGDLKMAEKRHLRANVRQQIFSP